MSKVGRKHIPDEQQIKFHPVGLSSTTLDEMNNFISEHSLKRSDVMREWLIKGFKLAVKAEELKPYKKTLQDELDEKMIALYISEIGGL